MCWLRRGGAVAARALRPDPDRVQTVARRSATGTAQSALGKALAYTVRQWPKLVLHQEHGEVPIHNNPPRMRSGHFLRAPRWLFANIRWGTGQRESALPRSCARANGMSACLSELHLREPTGRGLPWKRSSLLPWNVRAAHFLELPA